MALKSKIFNSFVACVTTMTILGCSSSPDKIQASYVSPLQYNHYDCDQIGTELLRVNRKVIEVSGVQRKEANKDSGAMAVGLILFWPALFFLAGTDRADELARLKGEYEALETVAIQKKCEVAEELKEARRQREEYEAKVKQKEAQQQTEMEPIH